MDAPLFRRLLVRAAGSLALLLAAGCGDRPDRMRLEPVPLPRGGSVETLELLETADEPKLVAPARASLFLRNRNENRWRRRRVEWPTEWKQTPTSPLATLLEGGPGDGESARRRFATHRGRIWFLARHEPSRGPILLTSDDRGQSWNPADLPDELWSSSVSGGGNEWQSLYRMSARVPVRLADRGDDGLFLIDQQAVWRGQFTDDGGFVGWKRVDLSTVDPLSADVAPSLPTVVRNYLPATEERPYELVTVFGERLSIHRRIQGRTEWTMVSTLPTNAIELHAPEGSETLYLLGPESVYRSRERGLSWQRSRIERRPESGTRNRTAAFVRPPEAPGRAPPGMLIGRADGSIYRSTDGATSWRRVHPPDPDQRGITALVTDPDDGRVWAATDGAGILASDDAGESWSTPGDQRWQRENRGLRAARPFAIARGPDGELVVGTDSGLFSLTSAPLDGHWRAKHRRATTSISVAPRGSRFITGTSSGGLVTLRGGDVVTTRPDPPARRPAPLFEPRASSPAVRRNTAILGVERRPDDDQTFAWSRHRGMFVSADGGVTWRAEPVSDALVSALEGAAIDNFVAGHGDRLYLTSRETGETPANQIWRSDQGGRTWRTVFTTAESGAHRPLLLRQPPDPKPGELFAAHRGRLTHSTDGGETWSERPGPWNDGTIVALRVGSDRHTVVFNLPQSTRIAFEPTDDESGTTRSYTVVWPNGDIRPRSDILDAVTLGQTHYLMTPDELYVGDIPTGETRLADAPTIIAMLLVVVLVVAASFWYLRFELGRGAAR